jgi:hypothetical protein
LIRRWIEEEDMDSDFDLFFSSEEGKRTAETKLFSEGYAEFFRCPEGKLTSFKLEYDDDSPTVVQCVSNRYYESSEELIDTFDFTVSQFALGSRYLLTGDLSLLHLDAKVLRLHSLPYPAATMRRMMKYRDSGYWIPEETALDYISAIQTGHFIDGRFANIDPNDAMRWYID